MESEVWKDVKGYEGYYQVSNMGRVKSMRVLKTPKNGVKCRKNAFLSTKTSHDKQSFTGSFGDSSVYSDIASFDMNLWKVYLKYLNAHKDAILLEMADMMVADAKEQRDVAIDEIESMKASLKILLDGLI